MSEAKFTPSEWTGQRLVEGWRLFILDDKGQRIAEVLERSTPGEMEANANLIINGPALPALVSALKQARVHVLVSNEAEHIFDGFGPRSHQPSDDLLERIDTALAKAKDEA